MRIYRSDGTFTENPDDLGFGWDLSELLNFPSLSSKSESVESLPNLLSNQDQSSSKPSVVIIEQHEPKIKIQPIKSVIDCQLEPEGLIEEKKTDKEKLENIDAKVPSKQQLSKLINPCTLESKMLLSVVHFAKYKKTITNKTSLKDIIDLNESKSDKINFIIDSKRDDVENNLRTQIQHYHETKEDNMLSIMMELILSDIKCDVDDISCDDEDDDLRNNYETSDLGNSIESSNFYCSRNGNQSIATRSEIQNRSDILSSIGLSDVIDKSIQRFCLETYEMRVEIDEIRKSFEFEDERVNRLIEEAKSLRERLKETTYLDELLELLNGNLEKIPPRRSPFRIFHGSLYKNEEINLIV